MTPRTFPFLSSRRINQQTTFKVPSFTDSSDMIAVHAKRRERSRCRLSADSCGPKETILLDGVTFGRIYSPRRGVIRRRCGVSSKFFDYTCYSYDDSPSECSAVVAIEVTVLLERSNKPVVKRQNWIGLSP